MWIKIKDELYNLDNVFGIGKYIQTYSIPGSSPDYCIRFYYIDDSLSNICIYYESEADRDRDFDCIIKVLSLEPGFYVDIDAKTK